MNRLASITMTKDQYDNGLSNLALTDIAQHWHRTYDNDSYEILPHEFLDGGKVKITAIAK